ncbi:MAG: KH domain-containing protein [Chlamydiae bacterium]|jgi:predicted RNA-binding protein YlqC (UPF0109 family)|nr:KH domain-containing protein [Chlamydiota bacterium]
MKEFIAYIVKNLVDQPDQVQVNVFEGQTSTIIEIQVADQDIAKLVGKQGRIIKSLRTIVMTVGARFGRKVKVELLQNKVTV